MKRGLLFLFLLILSFRSIYAIPEDQKWIVLSLHECLSNNQLKKGLEYYDQLQLLVGNMGYGSQNSFDEYMTTCVKDYGINIGADEVEKFYKMCLNRPNIRNEYRGKISAAIAATLCEYHLYESGISYYERMLLYEADMTPITFHKNLTGMGWAYCSCQMYQKAYLIFKRCADFYKKKFGPYSGYYATALHNMAYVEFFINCNNMDLLNEELAILQHRADTFSFQYAICLDNISTRHQRNHAYEQALPFALRANKIFESEDPNNIHYAISLNNIGSLYHKLKDVDTIYLQYAEEYLKHSLEVAHTNTAALNLALLYEDYGNMDLALELLNSIDERNRHANYALDVANYYARKSDYAMYATYTEDYLNYMRRIQQKNVLYMTAAERGKYIQHIQNENLETLFDFSSSERFETLPALCYNYLLLSKSLLLSYDSNIEDIVTRSSKKNIKDLYFSLSILQHKANKDPQAAVKADSLEHVFLDLLAKEENFSAFTNITYTDIQQTLHEGEVVIEFFENETYSSPKLYAVILRHEGLPQVVSCFDIVKEEEHIINEELASAIWSILNPHLKDVTRLYFSPSGHLHNYPFESELSLICPDLHVYRLTTSRELLKQHKKQKTKSATIYGGIQYDMDATDMEIASRQYQGEQLLASRSFDAADINRGHANYLPGTKAETEQINQLLKKNHVKASLYTANAANEESFKALSGKHQNVLHIATHGFYWTDSTAQQQKYFSQHRSASGVEMFSDDNSAAPLTIDPLNRCGLLFAGANIALQGYSDELPEGVQDGILTAKEISLLDLSDADIVVLSACETGTGDITGDGVFGLQRGFKKAGANSIIMSIWRVNDEATCFLMTEFYRQWITMGKSKREALDRAKQAVRSHKEKGWDAPYYWAAFILLDGLD